MLGLLNNLVSHSPVLNSSYYKLLERALMKSIVLHFRTALLRSLAHLRSNLLLMDGIIMGCRSEECSSVLSIERERHKFYGTEPNSALRDTVRDGHIYQIFTARAVLVPPVPGYLWGH